MNKPLCWVGVTGLALVGILLVKDANAPATLSAPIQELHDKPQTTVQVPVKVYNPSVKKDLNLPKAVQQSETTHVVTATEVPRNKRDVVVTAVVDEATGVTTQYVQEQPLPWVEADRSGHVGVYAGFKNLEPALRAEVRQDVVAVKGVKLGVLLSADATQSGRVDSFVGVGARYEW